MASGTFTLPSGVKARSASNRRFVIFYETISAKTGQPIAVVERRTDDLAKAKAYVSKSYAQLTVVDTAGRKAMVRDAKVSGYPRWVWVDA